MDDGRKPPPTPGNENAVPPSWTERQVPPARQPATAPLAPDDPDGRVPAADPIVRAAYSRSGALPGRPPAVPRAQEEGTDALVIRRRARQTRVLSFQAEGVHWRAGFAPDISQTPLQQYVPVNTPPDSELRAGNGFVLRPVDNALEAVLRDIVPIRLLMAGEATFGRARELAQIYLYFMPHGAAGAPHGAAPGTARLAQPPAGGASVGILAWYMASPTTRAHLLYLQTDIKKADERILDEMRKTFLAAHMARAHHGVSRRPFDFWEELELAASQVGATYRASALAGGAGQVKDRVRHAREQAESGLDRGLHRGLDLLAAGARLLAIEAPQRVLAALVAGASRVAIGVIRALDGVLGGRR